jgi:hypothetical protein
MYDRLSVLRWQPSEHDDYRLMLLETLLNAPGPVAGRTAVPTRIAKDARRALQRGAYG